MFDDQLAPKLLLAFFGIEDTETEEAKDIVARYNNRVAKIISGMMSHYLEANKEDKALKQLFKTIQPSLEEGNADPAEIDKIKDSPALKQLSNNISEAIKAYNNLLIESQVALLTQTELAILLDVLNEEKRSADYFSKQAIKQLKEFEAKQPGAPVPPAAQPVVTQLQPPAEVVQVQTNTQQQLQNLAQPNAQQPAQAPQPPAAPAQAAAAQPAPAHLNIVDQAMPQGQQLEQQIAPKLNLGGHMGGQTITPQPPVAA